MTKKQPYRTEKSGFDDLPKWAGASEVYSRCYRLMERHGADHDLIDALNYGDEERIKAILLYRYAGR